MSFNPDKRKQETTSDPKTCSNCRRKIKIGQTFFYNIHEGNVLCPNCQELSMKIYKRNEIKAGVKP